MVIEYTRRFASCCGECNDAQGTTFVHALQTL